MQPVANENLGPPAQGSAMDQAADSAGPAANIIYPEAFTGRVYADVMASASLPWDSAEAIDLGNAYQGDIIMNDPTREEIKAEIAASEARTDATIGRMEGKLELVVSKIDGINSRLDDVRTGINSRLDDVRNDYRATRANIWVVGLGLAVLIIAVAALFPVFFGIGTQIRDIIDKAIEAHRAASIP